MIVIKFDHLAIPQHFMRVTMAFVEIGRGEQLAVFTVGTLDAKAVEHIAHQHRVTGSVRMDMVL